ncbi:MAG: hypothetical protein IIX93_12910 [Clostridia bacterium]|nr:hypothetical protein [Clostridia bacterium]
MKNKQAFTAAVLWIFALAVAGIFLIFTSEKESRISDAENRMLQGFPKLSVKTVFNYEFTTQFESFLSDSFFERDRVINFTNDILDSFSMLSKDDEIRIQSEEMERDLQGVGQFSEEEVSGAEEEILVIENNEPVTEEEEEEEPSEKIAVAPGEILITDKNSYLWYEHTDGTVTKQYTYKLSDIATYAQTLRIMQSYLPEDGNILFTQVPLASMAQRWRTQQDSYSGWGSSVEIMLEDCLEGTERIHVFSTYDILEPYVCGDMPVFYVTDHHWTAEGAYIVATEMLKKLNLPIIPYDEYTYKPIRSEKAVDGVRDTFNVLYPLTPTHSYLVTKKDKLQEIDLMNYESTTYRAFMNNTRYPWRKIVTGANTGRRCLVVCDSFGNAFTPYLLAYYDEVHMVDFRSDGYSKHQAGGSIGEMMKHHKIDDVFIITSTANGLRKENSTVYLRKHLEG